MLKQRVITAVLLLAGLAAALWAGPTASAAAISLLLAAAAFEWLRLAQLAHPVAVTLAAGLAGILFAVDYFGVATPAITRIISASALVVWVGLALVLLQAERAELRIAPAISTLLCVVLLGGAMLGAMFLLRRGVTLLVSALAIVWVADTAAYFAGRRWGRIKLAPKISPGKTWAGVGGAIIAVLALALVALLALPHVALFSSMVLTWLPMPLGLLVLALLVPLSIVGDLFESLLKRQAGAKDSGRLLPGHGGVLDRIDALLPVLPAAALLMARIDA